MAVERQSKRGDEILSRGDIEALISGGRKIIIVDDRVLQVDPWLPYHPGGDKAILHMVGRDASNEVFAFHSAETLRLMHKYQIGRIVEQWVDFVPPIQGGTFGKQRQDAAGSERPSGHESPACESEDESSAAPSLIFDVVKPQSNSIRERRLSSDELSESSATSYESSNLDVTQSLRKSKAELADDLTRGGIEHDLEIYPSLDAHTQHNIVMKFRDLERRVREAGLYKCNYTQYLVEGLRYFLLALVSRWLLLHEWYKLSGLLLGLLWHQLVFTVHDAGHMGITHGYQLDSYIGMFIANYLGGLSLCWWKRNHNVHHIVTNSAEHDPDIQHIPFFAVSHRFFNSLRSTYYDRVMTYDSFAKFTLQFQHFTYYPLLAFGRFNLYVLSWQYILLGQGPRRGRAWPHRYFELVGQIFFWYWFGYRLLYCSLPDASTRIQYVLISHMITGLVHVQITLSHFAMSTADLGVAESFPQRMLRTTMDVDCPPWLDFFHGGLQFQAIHHLFPRVPRHNLRTCQKLVRDFCDEVKIPYVIYGFGEGNEKVISHLGEVAKQARILTECQRQMTSKDILHTH